LRRSALSFFDELHGVSHRDDGFRGVIGNLDPEFFLECHDEFHGIETVRPEILNETRPLSHLVAVDVEVFDNDFFYALSDVAHWIQPLALLVFSPRPATPLAHPRGQAMAESRVWYHKVSGRGKPVKTASES